MADERRGWPFIWVTWLSGLLSGDRQCQYALWFRANYKHERRQESRENDLTVWKGEHSEMVRRRAEDLTRAGHSVTIEDQNKFFVEGAVATLSGQPDIIARAPEPSTVLSIEDMKTGKRRDSDYWQVVIYMLFAPRRKGDVVTGAVVYRDTPVRPIQPGEAGQSARDRVVQMIKMAAATNPPTATPSGSECGRCDIANCRYRSGEDAIRVATEDF